MDEYDRINVTELAAYTNSFASSGLIDGPGNMTNDRVFILSGINDSTVLQGTSRALVYQHGGVAKWLDERTAGPGRRTFPILR